MANGPPRVLHVPSEAEGMRLDRFLARWFPDRSRSWLAQGVRSGEVRLSDGATLRPSTRLRGDEVLLLHLPGIAPRGPAPPFPPILHLDEHVIVVDKPPGLLVHPAGTDFAWSVIGLARERWPHDRLDLVHRLDRDTSGVLILARDPEANTFLKEAIKAGKVHKEYEAFVKGRVPWDRADLRGPIGPAGGLVRIQMAVRREGLRAHTEVEVVERSDALTRVRCILHTGRTHQIRVHLAHAGFPLLGDRLYGVPPELFDEAWRTGDDAELVRRAGAPRHALHAARVVLPHPSGETLELQAPLPGDLRALWSESVTARSP